MKPQYEAFPITEATEDVAVAVGGLMAVLSPRFKDEPLELDSLQERIDSPFHDQLVVVERDQMAIDDTHRVIGAASMSMVLGSGVRLWGERNRKAVLEDFVVAEDSRGTGAAELLWLACVAWCEEHDASKMEFTSEPHRAVARRFYARMGAELTADPYFVFEIPNLAEEAAA